MNVFRKTLTLLIVWAGLLGAAEPLLAWVGQTDSSDCCAVDSSSLCDTGSGLAAASATLSYCCVAPPTLISTYASVAKRDGEQERDSVGSGDPGVIAPPTYGAMRPPALPIRGGYSSSSPTTEFGTQTYLRTARLRL